MTNKEEEIIAQEKATFVFGLPLTEEEKQTIIDILRKDFVWKEGNSSYQIKKRGSKYLVREKRFRIERYEVSFEEQCENESIIRKRLYEFAEMGLLDTITIAFASCWNLKDDFAVVRKIVRKYTDNEYDYYRERSKELKLIVSFFDVLDSRIGFLRKIKYDSKVEIYINGDKYKISKSILDELKKTIKDKKELVRILKEEATPVPKQEDSNL